MDEIIKLKITAQQAHYLKPILESIISQLSENKDEIESYNDIYREFLSTYRWYEYQIEKWEPAGGYKIRVWTKVGPVYIYDHTTKSITLEVDDEPKKII